MRLEYINVFLNVMPLTFIWILESFTELVEEKKRNVNVEQFLFWTTLSYLQKRTSLLLFFMIQIEDLSKKTDSQSFHKTCC